jgi:hypothetical protein
MILLLKLYLYLVLSDVGQIQLLMYEDPVSGPRTMPDMNDIQKGKVAVPDSAQFHINVPEERVVIQSNGKKLDIGQTLVYIVKS